MRFMACCQEEQDGQAAPEQRDNQPEVSSPGPDRATEPEGCWGAVGTAAGAVG